MIEYYVLSVLYFYLPSLVFKQKEKKNSFSKIIVRTLIHCDLAISIFHIIINVACDPI